MGTTVAAVDQKSKYPPNPFGSDGAVAEGEPRAPFDPGMSASLSALDRVEKDTIPASEGKVGAPSEGVPPSVEQQSEAQVLLVEQKSSPIEPSSVEQGGAPIEGP